jgi:excisionase family DNA binding protein
MNREEAAEALGISVRSLQRTVKAGKLTVKYRRGSSGKQEAIFDPEEIEQYKASMEAETVHPATASGENQALATMRDMDVARSVALARNSFAAMFEAMRPANERPSVAIEAKLVLTLPEASALTNFSRGHLLEAIKNKKLKAKIIGRGWRIKRDNLDAYVKKL